MLSACVLSVCGSAPWNEDVRCDVGVSIVDTKVGRSGVGLQGLFVESIRTLRVSKKIMDSHPHHSHHTPNFASDFPIQQCLRLVFLRLRHLVGTR